MRCMRYRDGKKALILDHVGNYARFGMPDEDREWTLEKRKRNIKKEAQENEEKVRQCPECFYTFAFPPGQAAICPHCGYAFPKKSRELNNEQNTELIHIDGFRLDFSSADDCHSYSDLLSYAKKKGYKKGWAFYEARKRGYIY